MGPESTVPVHPQPRPFIQQQFLDFREKNFPEWPLIFLIITIHQVIWPSPGTLQTNNKQTPPPFVTHNVWDFFPKSEYFWLTNSKFPAKKNPPISNVKPQPFLRWGWVFLERTRILSGIQFTTYFIEIFVVETKRFVGSFVHVILTQQTCGQRSSRAAESKRRAIGNYFSE